MKAEIVDRIKEIALELTSVLSVVNTSGETVVLIGHTDTVGISDYGNIKEYANKPFELAEKMKGIELPKAVKDDLESGNYLFGRGIFDMKSGVAVLMGLIEEISNNIEEFEGNLVFSAVCDEEANSGGMINLVPELVKMKEKEGFDYQAILDTDYMTGEYDGDENKYIYVGTVGKIMPTFLVVGKETHVGESFKGIDPNQISSEIAAKINLNVEYCDVAEGEVSLPPITLKQRDLKTEYSCQIATKSIILFNYATFNSTPDQVLEKMMKAAEESFETVIEKLNKRYVKFCEMAKRPYEELPWKARVISYDELYSKVKKEVKDLDERLESYIEELKKNEAMDQVERTTEIVNFVHDLWSDRNPVVIVYFTPPYYPHIYVEGKSDKDKKLLDAVSNAVDTTETEYKLVYKKFFPYISDLSYGAAPKDPKVISALKQNLPGFGPSYDIPISDMQELDLPVLDIGTYGKDAHKFTERIEKKYSYEVVPDLVYKTIVNLLK
ncbi:M20/M25/M40 family metallo-hydrolase [Sedimentibacter sp. MB35-C1]|uniref:M20/M25/M40 family metallo-hydrolase n=1 Tax=Sedimentibacter sp. MB35-C1 TaxID=3070995 RepID=UPI0027E0F3F8|nr:M20/M25/M40 family metallo-hydrolase [Sedimentibacter sp. MB35-C1]WMJ78198.1 M20/M25/M40 family metallo-hydrolase [Sedimentibacter sp. MB35-C1]